MLIRLFVWGRKDTDFILLYTFLFITKESFLQEVVIGRSSKPSTSVNVGNIEDVENMLASECDFGHTCRKNKHLHVLCNETVP